MTAPRDRTPYRCICAYDGYRVDVTLLTYVPGMELENFSESLFKQAIVSSLFGL